MGLLLLLRLSHLRGGVPPASLSREARLKRNEAGASTN